MSYNNNHNQISREYVTALSHFWNGRPQTAIEHLTTLLADNPDRGDRFMLYRLWVDILAEQKDFMLLKSLADHLHILGMIDSNRASSYMAIRGLVHFELDELEAAKFYARAVGNGVHNPYSHELAFRLEQRTSLSPVLFVTMKSKSKLSDYFHLKCAVDSAHDNGDHGLANSLLKQVGKLYPDSPLPLQYRVQVSLREERFDDARKYLDKLSELFPANHDYLVYSAFSCVQSEKYQQALKYLGTLMNRGAEDDLDVNLLFAECYRNLFAQTGDATLQDKLNNFEQRVEDLWSTDEKTDQILSISDKTPEGQTMASQNRKDVKAWMVKLDSAEYYNLQSQAQEAMTHTLSEHAMPGDIVVFAGDNYQDPENSWRMGAVYSVESDPTWHPVRGYECQLTPMHQLEASIPFEVVVGEVIQSKSTVIELDHDAIELLIKAVQDFSSVDEENGLMIRDLERMRMSS